MDYFIELRNKLESSVNIEVADMEIKECKMNYSFELFGDGISDQIRAIYNSYKKFFISWKESSHKMHGYIDFVPYEEIFTEHKEMCDWAEAIDEELIENQDIVINDLKNWYPVFRFRNGDAFCYDRRTGKIVFFEHEVFDTGINLHGLVIAKSMDYLLENWSKVLFVDIYDWYEGVNENGIDLSKSVYKDILN